MKGASESQAMVGQTVRPTCPCFTPLAYLLILVRFANTAPLILPPDADQHWSEISPLAASEIFTQGRKQRIVTGSPHPNGSVNGALVWEAKEGAVQGVYLMYLT